MPTRIVLRETEAPSQLSPRNRSIIRGANNNHDDLEAVHRTAQRMPLTNNNDNNNVSNLRNSLQTSPRASSRRIVGFRSSILREPEEIPKKEKSALSNTDIRASPRLLGYLFQLIASTVMLITVIQFYRAQNNNSFLNYINEADWDDLEKFFASVNGPVYYWKLIGTVIVGSIGSAVSVLVLLVHFDTICAPRLWFMIFRDGSKAEYCLLILLVLFWMAALHVSTSTLSVGAVQANVFFTTWIAFASAVLNCGVWRVSAGLPSLAEKITLHHRETTYNWVWTLFCVFILAGAVTDSYFNRDVITLRFKGVELDLSDRGWIIIVSIAWGFVGVCLVALLLNHFMTKTIQVRLCGKNRFLLGWRQFEGFVVLIMVGVFFWIIYKHTGVNGVVNGLNNAYIGVWGSFFNAVFTFGTWLRENRNIEYIINNDNNNNNNRN